MFSDRTVDPSFPYQKEWKWLLSHIPEDERYDADGTMGGERILTYLARMINDSDIEISKRYALAFEAYEFALCSPHGKSFEEIKADVSEDPNLISAARIELLYVSQGCFIPEGYITQNVKGINHIPCHIVQGSRDWCTPPQYAYELQKAYGALCHVEVVDSGHLRSDPHMKESLQTT